MENTRPTLKDVAKVSGYALRTVNKVISGNERVGDKARETILRVARELGYKKNNFASALAKGKNVKIAIVYTEITSAYFPEVKKGFLNCAEEWRDLGVTVEFLTIYEKGYEHQTQVLQKILQSGSYNGVIIQPISKTKLDPIIDKLVAQGIPVITFGGDCITEKRLCYIGPDAYKSGRIGAQILANYVGGQGTVFIISQGIEHMQTVDRIRGFHDRVREYNPKIQAFEITIPDNSNLYYDMVKTVVKNENVVGLFCTDANSYVAGEVMKDLGRTDISVVGFDMSPMAAALMKDEYLKVIIDQNAEKIAYSSLKAMLNYIYNGTIPEKKQLTDVSIIISEYLQ